MSDRALLRAVVDHRIKDIERMMIEGYSPEHPFEIPQQIYDCMVGLGVCFTALRCAKPFAHGRRFLP